MTGTKMTTCQRCGVKGTLEATRTVTNGGVESDVEYLCTRCAMEVLQKLPDRLTMEVLQAPPEPTRLPVLPTADEVRHLSAAEAVALTEALNKDRQ